MNRFLILTLYMFAALVLCQQANSQNVSVQLTGSSSKKPDGSPATILKWTLLPANNQMPYVFVVERSDAGSSSFKEVGSFGGRNEWHDGIKKDLQPGSTYHYRVRVANTDIVSNTISVSIL